MRITKIETIYQLAFMPRFFPVNCYLVEEEEELTLIDAALPFSVQKIIKAAKQIGKPITRIIITHAHEDHVGALDGLKALLPNALIYISYRDAKLLKGDHSLLEYEPNTPIRGGVPKHMKVEPDILLQDGDYVGSLQVISSPGHTPGSISLLDIRNNSLIVGDAFQIKGGLAVAGVIRPWFPFPALATWDKQTAIESARKLRNYNPSLLAAGHGKMLKQPGNDLDIVIKEAEIKLSQSKNKE